MERRNLLDIMRSLDPDKSYADCAEILTENNPIVEDMPMFPSNNAMGHRVTRRSTLPTVYRGKLNMGLTKSKSRKTQVVDTIGMYTGRAEVDSRTSAWVGSDTLELDRGSEEDAFLEKFTQTIAYDLLYGDEDTYESGMTGLQPRLETAATAKTGSQVAKHHSSPSGSDYTSIYIVDWGERAVHGIYPMNHKMAGLDIQDRGIMDVLDSESLPFPAYVTDFHWYVGLAVHDNRHIGRLANIDVSQALADTTTLLTKSLIPMLNRMPKGKSWKRVMYCSTDIKTALEQQLKHMAGASANNVFLSMQEYLGEMMLHVHGVPVRDVDQISQAESLVS